MIRQATLFLIRWSLNAFGLWVAVRWLGTGYDDQVANAGFWGFVLAAFVFSLINAFIKPVLVVLSLPALVVTLGLFTLIINGIIVYVALALAPGISMSFGNSILTGFLLSLLNYIVGLAVQTNRHARSIS